MADEMDELIRRAAGWPVEPEGDEPAAPISTEDLDNEIRRVAGYPTEDQ